MNTALKTKDCYSEPRVWRGITRQAKENFLENLNRLFDGTGLKDIRLAEELGVAPVTIGRWRRGDRIPNFESLDKIAAYFKCSVQDLFYDPTDANTKSKVISMDLNTALRVVEAHARAGKDSLKD